MPIHELVEKHGALDVLVQGTVIDIRPGSGFVMRCPECNRVLMNEECSIHGKVEGKPDMRLKLVVDDGTGAVSSVVNREISEKILGISMDDAKKLKEDELQEEIEKKLFAKKVSLRGNALGDDFGTSIIASNVDFVEVNVPEEAEKLVNSLEDLL